MEGAGRGSREGTVYDNGFFFLDVFAKAHTKEHGSLAFYTRTLQVHRVFG